MAKSLWGLTVAFIGVLMCCIIRYSAVYMRNMDILNEKMFSFDLNTVGKYSVMGLIQDDLWKKFTALHQ